MKCEYCGMWINASPGPVRVHRWRPLSSTPHASIDERSPVDMVAASASTTCSGECAQRLLRLWQDEDLADDILRALHRAADEVATMAVGKLIEMHRARWTYQEEAQVAQR